MRIVVTGGAGFIGRQVVTRLAGRGDQVIALVRHPMSSAHLAIENVGLVASDLSDRAAMSRTFADADAVIHAAGSYRVGIAESERPQMWDANVGTTERVLGAARGAGVPRIVYLSTNNVYGDTHGTQPDEAYRRDLSEGFLSYYDETKFRAHEVAERYLADGAPIVIVQPSQTYGPHDHSAASEQLALAHAGKLRTLAFGKVGLCWVHVHDLAGGIVSVLDRGRIGEAYSLSGECRRLAESVALAAHIGGHPPPRLGIPTTLLRLMAPINDHLVRMPGAPADLSEVIRASNGVTYWASHEKATRELGFQPRSLEQGIVDTWGRA